ncbi:SDR family oxidoreductase [Streptomyces flavofungini]|uniref:SDR family oxidoreductase n=1 Tax=Streptomyces flavofungini TaxID=68200 RepID=UPI0025B16792|nr:SDR family oxidoreductase [Streptomyces flavofungini]WJV47109.1 SDR family oxidoreductase [Streptomyces flavofungini]
MTRLTVLVTGAGTGIGNQTVRALAEAGHTVYASMRDTTGRNAERAQDLRAYATTTGVDVRVVELDVGSQQSADTAVRTVLSEQDHLDVVVHNAAHLGIGINEAFTDTQIAAILDTNTIGPHRLNRAVLPHMRAREQGLLLYVGSTTSRMVYPFQGPYEASKAAMDSLAEVTRYEVARYGIDVAIVTPGAITTGTAHFSEGTRPADQHVADAYERLAGVEQHIMDRLAELSPPDADPRAVGDEIARVVALPPGQRPLRTTIDFLSDGAEQVNNTAQQLQAALMDRLGIADLLHPTNATTNR